jgi:hypothetical protein
MAFATKRALIVVRTYPTPARNGVEVSCTAAITSDGKWLRLFPVPYRRLSPEQQFHKYQWIDVGVEKATDPRPESHRIRQDTIQIVSHLPTDHHWQARKDIILPLRAESMCAIQQQRDDYGAPTLGIFKPASFSLIIEQSEQPTWSEAQLSVLRQGDLFDTDPPEELEKVPFDFSYQCRCATSNCSGHRMKCTDWELGQSWRKWRDEYGARWQDAFRETYDRKMRDEYDTHFYVGTLNQYPNAWIIVGLFYPPKYAPLPLFDTEYAEA